MIHFFILTVSVLLTPLVVYSEDKAHVHGSALVNLAVEGPLQVEVLFDIPGESAFGFERVAKSPKEKAAVEKALKVLVDRADEIILFPPASVCKASGAKAEIEKDEHHSKATHQRSEERL